MNKKGFTLIEVIVSIVLVSVVLTSMLASLVKLKTSYEVVSENTDALIFSSSLSRIINNDFDSNGGIRYIDCTYFGDVCDITLNNNEKRRLEIKSVQSGLTWHQHYEQYAKQFGVEISGLSNDKKQIFFKNIAIKLNNPILLSKPFSNIIFTISSLASFGNKSLIKFAIISIDTEKYEASITNIEIIGIKAKTKKKAILPGNILNSTLLK